MSDKKLIITPEQMRHIARYEITFKDVLCGADIDDVCFVCPEMYTFTLYDLYYAIMALKEADPDVREFGKYWFYPITEHAESFKLNHAQGYESDDDGVPEDMKGYPGLLVSDFLKFRRCWWLLEYACENFDDESPLSEILAFDTLLTDFEKYFANKGKPIEEWAFPQMEMEEYIRFFDDDDFLKEADEKKLALARKFIEILCAEDSETALHIKGYACYGGNRLYDCDWDISRDCMLKLFEKTDDPQYANTLGYIYYYGRCNGFVPEYDKAFYYYGIAAANGLYEGMYKLADMFANGYGCRESKRTACTLYKMVYNDSINHFLKGANSNFADAALRMGHVYAEGIGEQINIIAAYHYYLQADYAAKIRAREDDFFGYNNVAANSQRALEETEERLPDGFFKDYLDYAFPFLFEELAQDNNRCILSKAVDVSCRGVLAAERMKSQSVQMPEAILLTIPQLKICKRTLKGAYTLDESAEIWFRKDADNVHYDHCTWNELEDRCEFYYDYELVTWIRSDKYRVYAMTEEEVTDARPSEG